MDLADDMPMSIDGNSDVDSIAASTGDIVVVPDIEVPDSAPRSAAEARLLQSAGEDLVARNQHDGLLADVPREFMTSQEITCWLCNRLST